MKTPQEDRLTFSPREQLGAMLRWWQILAALMLAGAALGWGVHFLEPPVYEARAVISTSINFARTGVLTDIEEDNAMGTAGDVILSPEVVADTVQAANAAGLGVRLEDFRSAASAERTDAEWFLSVRSRDPQTAARLANLWSETAQAALTDALTHAIRAEGLRRYQDSLAGCVEQSVEAGPATAACSEVGLAAIQKDLSETSTRAIEETVAGKGILPAMSFQVSQEASAPPAPVRNHRAVLILAGALVGLGAGVWGISAGLPEALIRRQRAR